MSEDTLATRIKELREAAREATSWGVTMVAVRCDAVLALLDELDRRSGAAVDPERLMDALAEAGGEHPDDWRESHAQRAWATQIAAAYNAASPQDPPQSGEGPE